MSIMFCKSLFTKKFTKNYRQNLLVVVNYNLQRKLEQTNLKSNIRLAPAIQKKGMVPIMPLTFAATGEVNTIKAVRGRNETVRFLESMGFVEGAAITVVSKLAGNLIVNVKDARVALNKDLASKIMI